MTYGRSRRWCCAFLVFALGFAVPAFAQEVETEAETGETASLRPKLSFGLEAKANYRNSELNRFAVPFPFPPSFLPPGQTRGFEETVNAGSHLEMSAVTLLIDATWGDGLAAHGKIDFIDLYDRNPTSTDKKTDVDEAWVRFGIEPEPATLAPRWGAYLKIGKMPKFERQDDRHLESYGLVSTAFNRFEDTGVEAGLNLGRHVYLKATATQGNPVFLRDPNALAGDNGTPDLRLPNPDPELKSGIVHPLRRRGRGPRRRRRPGDRRRAGRALRGRGRDQGRGLPGLGLPADPGGDRGARRHVLWRRSRPAARTGRPDALPVPPRRREARGRRQPLALPGRLLLLRAVRRPGDRRAAAHRHGGRGRPGASTCRSGWRSATGSSSPTSAPAVRYSEIDNDFRNHPQTPSPSLAWDWKKLDSGLRVGILSGVDLTLEYADNRFILGIRGGAEQQRIPDDLPVAHMKAHLKAKMKRALLLLVLLPLAASAAAEEIRGRVQLVAKGGKGPAKGSDVRQAVVSFEPAKGGGAVRAARGPEAGPFVMTTRKKQFEPRVLAIPRGSRVRFPNEDVILHNVFSVSSGNAFDLGLYRKGPGKEQKFDQAGLVRVYCNVHHPMVAYVLVLDTPFFVTPGRQRRVRALRSAQGTRAADRLARAGRAHGDGDQGCLRRRRSWRASRSSVPSIPPHLNKSGQSYFGSKRDRYNQP